MEDNYTDEEKARTNPAVGKDKQVVPLYINGEVALSHAETLISNFDDIFGDDEKRKKVTVASGLTLGAALGDLVLSGKESLRDEERLNHFARGSQTLMEILMGAALGVTARTREKKQDVPKR